MAVGVQVLDPLRLRGVGELVPVAGVEPEIGEVEEGLVSGDGVGAEGVFEERVPLKRATATGPSRSASVGGGTGAVEVRGSPDGDAFRDREGMREPAYRAKSTGRRPSSPSRRCHARVAIESEGLLPFKGMLMAFSRMAVAMVAQLSRAMPLID